MDPTGLVALIRQCAIAILWLMALPAMTPPVGAEEGTPAPDAPFMGEAFVGETSDPETLVAIVLGEEEAGVRPARGYLCNGLLRTVDVWLIGEADGVYLSLAAEDGSQLAGILNPAGIGGAVTLGSGENLLFTAPPATGAAGPYTVEMVEGGRLEGSSATGATLIGALQGDGADDSGRFRYDVNVSLLAGGAATLTISTGTTEEGTFRAIVLPSGEGQGQGESKRTRDWIDPEPQP